MQVLYVRYGVQDPAEGLCSTVFQFKGFEVWWPSCWLRKYAAIVFTLSAEVRGVLSLPAFFYLFVFPSAFLSVRSSGLVDDIWILMWACGLQWLEDHIYFLTLEVISVVFIFFLFRGSTTCK